MKKGFTYYIIINGEKKYYLYIFSQRECEPLLHKAIGGFGREKFQSVHISFQNDNIKRVESLIFLFVFFSGMNFLYRENVESVKVKIRI